MRYLVCPQCGIRRFAIRNDQGGQVVVQVNQEHQVVSVQDGTNLEGFNSELLFCLGCSWKGTVRELKKYL